MSDNFLAARDATQRVKVHAWEAKQQAARREMKFSLYGDKFSYRSSAGRSQGAKFVSCKMKSSHLLQVKIGIRSMFCDDS